MKENEESLTIESENYGVYSFWAINIFILLNIVMVIAFHSANVSSAINFHKSESHWMTNMIAAISVPLSILILIYLCFEVYKQMMMSIYRIERILYFPNSIKIEYDYIFFKKKIEIDLVKTTLFSVCGTKIEQYCSDLINGSSLNEGIHSNGNIEIISENKKYFLGKNMKTDSLNRIISFYSETYL